MRYLKNRIASFGYAIAGIIAAFRSQAHMKIHFLAAIIVISTAVYFDIEKWEWVAILLCIALVISLEMLNSAIEKLCDFISLEKHDFIKYIKDVAAGAVLIAAIIAIVIALIIFWERVFGIFFY